MTLAPKLKFRQIWHLLKDLELERVRNLCCAMSHAFSISRRDSTRSISGLTPSSVDMILLCLEDVLLGKHLLQIKLRAVLLEEVGGLVKQLHGLSMVAATFCHLRKAH